MNEPVLNGPATAAWLREHDLTHLSDNHQRRIRDWASGTQARESTVDLICCELDVHLDEIPGHVRFGWPAGAVVGLEYDPCQRVFKRVEGRFASM